MGELYEIYSALLINADRIPYNRNTALVPTQEFLLTGAHRSSKRSRPTWSLLLLLIGNTSISMSTMKQTLLFFSWRKRRLHEHNLWKPRLGALVRYSVRSCYATVRYDALRKMCIFVFLSPERCDELSAESRLVIFFAVKAWDVGSFWQKPRSVTVMAFF